MDIELTYNAKFNEHAVTIEGETMATAHCVNVPLDMWSVKIGKTLIGLAKSERIAVATLEKVAQQTESGVHVTTFKG